MEEDARTRKKGKAKIGEETFEMSHKQRRRQIKQQDYILGQGIGEYDLIKDLQTQKVNITFGQLLALNSKLRRQWSKGVSTRISKKKKRGDAHALKVGHASDLVPLVDATLGKNTQVHAYVDGGAEVCVMTEYGSRLCC